MNAPNNTLGESLAKGLIKRWSREQEGLQDRLWAIGELGMDMPPRQRLNKVLRALRALQSRSPWIVHVEDAGKRKNRLLQAWLLSIVDGRAELVIVTYTDDGDAAHSRKGTVRLVVTRHALLRLVQSGRRDAGTLGLTIANVAYGAHAIAPVREAQIHVRSKDGDFVAVLRRDSLDAPPALVTTIPWESWTPGQQRAFERGGVQEIAA